MKKSVLLLLITFCQGCSAMKYQPTNKIIELDRFMGTWFVQKGRVTFLEKGAYNPTEIYKYNNDNDFIEISFTFNKNSLEGKPKSIPQKGFVINEKTNAHWEVSPFWPIRFDYLVLDFAEDYSWTAIGVPSGKYLWIMTRQKHPDPNILENVMQALKKTQYPIDNIESFEHSKD